MVLNVYGSTCQANGILGIQRGGMHITDLILHDVRTFYKLKFKGGCDKYVRHGTGRDGDLPRPPIDEWQRRPVVTIKL